MSDPDKDRSAITGRYVTDAEADANPDSTISEGRESSYVKAEWRTGRKVGRTIYAGDILIGMMDTPELARAAVRAHNDDRD